MKRALLILLVGVSILMYSAAFASTRFFVDFGASFSGDGTFARPWNNLTSVKNYTFRTGDDLYFKCGTTSSGNEKLVVNWAGTENDSVIIGAYYESGGSPVVGINKDGRPNIHGNNFAYPAQYDGLIMVTGAAYVTVQDLQTSNSYWSGIRWLDNSDHGIIRNCVSYRSKSNGILVFRSKYVTVENNVIREASYLTKPTAGIEITGGYVEGRTTNITVRGNTVFNSFEGIGLYKCVSNCIVERNVVYDNRSYHIYVSGGSHDSIIRYNIVYNSNGKDKRRLICLADEAYDIGRFTIGLRNMEVYGNLLASGGNGIALENGVPALTPTNIKIYNNTIVDCDYNFRFWDNWNGTNVVIKNNISAIYESGTHVRSASEKGFVWSHNNFNEDVFGMASTEARIHEPKLRKASGWRSLGAGMLDGSEFSLTAESSNRDAGIPINGYNERIHFSAITDSGLGMEIAVDNTPDIGAWMVNDEPPEESIPPTPSALRITEQ